MKKYLIMGGILLVLLIFLGIGGCTRVMPGHVGVKVNQFGSSAGVEDKALPVGTYFTLPGTSIYEYPIYTNTKTWTRTETEDSKVNEEFSFQDKNGLVVTADVAIAYRVDPTKAPILYQKYRMDMDAVVAGPMRNAVRSALVDVASNMSVEEIYGPKKIVLANKALQIVQGYFEKFGLHIEQLYWAGPVRIPDNILKNIQLRASNEQAAIAAQANVATIEAQAKARVAEAQGEADATKVKAIAEADAMTIRAQALEKNPKLVQYEWVNKWSGNMPNTVYCTSATPCVQTGQ